MHQRCSNPKNRKFGDYGGRGIKVCERWKTFEPFWEDMGQTWGPGLTIEREDFNGDYEPSNCTWITRAAQSRNRRTVTILETQWGPMTLPEAAAKMGFSHAALWRRYKLGWRGERLFSPPVDKGARVTPRVHRKAA